MEVKIGPYVDEGDREETVVIHDYDTWNMDHTLALMVLPMLKQLQVTKHGAPNVDIEDTPPELWPTDKETMAYNLNGDTDSKFFKRWDYVMGEMIFAFTNKVNEWEDSFFDYGEEEKANKVTIEFKGVGPCQLRLFPDEEGSMEDYELYEWVQGRKASFDKDGHKAYQERITNGFRLFGKYYESLWD
jgi:hypothetical protein